MSKLLIDIMCIHKSFIVFGLTNKKIHTGMEQVWALLEEKRSCLKRNSYEDVLDYIICQIHIRFKDGCVTCYSTLYRWASHRQYTLQRKISPLHGLLSTINSKQAEQKSNYIIWEPSSHRIMGYMVFRDTWLELEGGKRFHEIDFSH